MINSNEFNIHMFEFLWIYMHTHMFYVKLQLIYVYIKKQAGKPCKRANALSAKKFVKKFAFKLKKALYN